MGGSSKKTNQRNGEGYQGTKPFNISEWKGQTTDVFKEMEEKPQKKNCLFGFVVTARRKKAGSERKGRPDHHRGGRGEGWLGKSRNKRS